MDHMKRNIRLRLVMIDRTTGDIARLLGVKPSAVRRRMMSPVKHLGWWAIVLCVSIQAISTTDAAVIVRHRQPPDGWEGRLKTVLERRDGGSAYPGDLVVFTELAGKEWSHGSENPADE